MLFRLHGVFGMGLEIMQYIHGLESLAWDCGRSQVRPCVLLVHRQREHSQRAFGRRFSCPVQSARQCGGPVNQVVWEVRIIFGLVLNYYYLTYYLYGLFAEWC